MMVKLVIPKRKLMYALIIPLMVSCNYLSDQGRIPFETNGFWEVMEAPSNEGEFIESDNLFDRNVQGGEENDTFKVVRPNDDYPSNNDRPDQGEDDNKNDSSTDSIGAPVVPTPPG